MLLYSIMLLNSVFNWDNFGNIFGLSFDLCCGNVERYIDEGEHSVAIQESN